MVNLLRRLINWSIWKLLLRLLLNLRLEVTLLLLISLGWFLVNLRLLLNHILLIVILLYLTITKVITLMIIVKLIYILVLLLDVPFVSIFGELKVTSWFRILNLLSRVILLIHHVFSYWIKVTIFVILVLKL